MEDFTRKQIAWDMYYGLPTQKYLTFVAKHLLRRDGASSLVDPFAIDFSEKDALERGFILRTRIERELLNPGPQIILGKDGSGKTLLFRKLPRLMPADVLNVSLPLAEIGDSVWGEKVLNGEISLLTAEILIPRIFNAYWENLFTNPVKRILYYPQLRQNRWWLSRLLWFFRQYPPARSVLAEEFELMAWLNLSSVESPFNPLISAEERLRELAQFVTLSIPLSERTGENFPVSPYQQIQVLVDGTEHLSEKAVRRLVQDAQYLHDLYLSGFSFKLFMGMTWRSQIHEMDCVRQGRMNIILMPAWDEEELKQMLAQRVRAYTQDEDFNWVDLIGQDYLDLMGRTYFIRTITHKLTLAKEHDTKLDAPIHALRLARAFVAACAGCWDDVGFCPPISYAQLLDLANIYWSEMEEK